MMLVVLVVAMWGSCYGDDSSCGDDSVGGGEVVVVVWCNLRHVTETMTRSPCVVV